MKLNSGRIAAIGASIVLSGFLLAVRGLSAGTGLVLVGELTRQYNVTPGGSYSGLLTLVNSGESPGSARIYQTDYRFNADGLSYYDPPGLLPRSNAKWIRVGAGLITVPPKETVKIPFKISVPNDQTLIGSFWSVIMVAPVAKHPLQATENQATQTRIGMGSEMRYAVQIVTDIGQTGQRKLSFTQPKLVGKDKDREFRLDLVNTGQCWLSPMVWLDLYNSKGVLVGRYKGEKMRIYPGCSVRQRIRLGAINPGDYQAMFFADNGDKHVFGARYTLKVAAP